LHYCSFSKRYLLCKSKYFLYYIQDINFNIGFLSIFRFTIKGVLLTRQITASNLNAARSASREKLDFKRDIRGMREEMLRVARVRFLFAAQTERASQTRARKSWAHHRRNRGRGSNNKSYQNTPGTGQNECGELSKKRRLSETLPQ
jgi:hypothetical protein